MTLKQIDDILIGSYDKDIIRKEIMKLLTIHKNGLSKVELKLRIKKKKNFKTFNEDFEEGLLDVQRWGNVFEFKKEHFRKL